jgi:FtsP/CotA-like multicopper oxidase with cupredoxin domain
MISRRKFIQSSTALALSAPLAALTTKASANGVIELRAQKTAHKLAGDVYADSDLWLYNGSTPGPEVRVKQGERVRVHFINELDEPTSIHWHGIRIDNAMDGVSGLTQEPVPPSGTFDYDFVAPDAGTFWYHAHNKSWSQVARGLYGPLIVEESDPAFDSNHDLTLMIDDWRLGNDGALHLDSMGAFMDWSHGGRLGNWLTVNGTSQPEFKLNADENYRLRLINASNARMIQISPVAINALVLGYDGFVFEGPAEPDNEYLSLAPAQRVDLLVNRPSGGKAELNDAGDFALQELSGQEALSLAKFSFSNSKTTGQQSDIKLIPNRIKAPDLGNAVDVPLIMTGGAMGRMGTVSYQGKPLGRADVMRTKQAWAFNGVANLADEPLFRVERGQTVVLKTGNKTGWIHGMHVHGHHFKILSRQREELPANHWRDTFIIDGDETVEIAFVADNPGKWLLHCHMLEHAAAGMQTWFEVT